MAYALGGYRKFRRYRTNLSAARRAAAPRRKVRAPRRRTRRTWTKKPRVRRGGKWQTNMPAVRKLKMKVHTSISLTGAPAKTYVFRGNSVFDPDVTATGIQPQMFDDMTAMYGSYTVTSSKIQVQWKNTANLGTTVGIEKSLSSTPIVLTNITADPFLTRHVKCHSLPSYLLGSTNGVMSQKDYDTTKRMFEVKDVLSDGDYAGNGGNPTNQWYWILHAQDSLDPTTGTNVQISCEVILTYYVIWRKLTVINMD